MSHHFLPGRRRASFAVVTVAAVVTAGIAGSTSYAVTGHDAATPSRTEARHVQPGARGFYDARHGQGISARSKALRTAGQVAARPATTAFRAKAPGQTVLDIDGTTGTVRMLTRLDGFLTGKSGKVAKKVALGYVRQHHAALGLARADLKTFHLKRNYRDITGAHHLFFIQRIHSRVLQGNGLTASVNRQGHLLTVGGSPVPKALLGRVTLPSSPRLATAADALTAARRMAAVPAGADLSGDRASRGLLVTPSGAHLVWSTVVMSSPHPALTMIDAASGRLLLRRPLTNYESGDSSGTAYRFFPGAPKGGKQVRVDFTKKGWLSRSAHVLKGNNSHTYSDVNDNDRPSRSEEVRAARGQSWAYRLKPFHLSFAKSFCSNPWPCSWNPNKKFSWKANRAQNATQVFFFVNTWHDHLKKSPIGFTEAAGNFQTKNSGKAGRGHDAVATQTDDGANTAGGLPDGSHIDNANMSTPPDGSAPTMQMYLQHAPGAKYPSEDPFSPTNVGDEADTVYHEYTHGLSNRLNVDVQGVSTLGGVQAGAMGEAWSDWYAMDYLVKQGLQKDKRNKVDVRLFKYDGVGVNFDRTEALDCTPSSKVKLCSGGTSGHRGGYTYRDYGKVAGGPEVHGDGEIWAQTLWSLRDKLGSRKTVALVTRAMELAPYDPSFLDMRNAILVADTSLFHGKGRAAIWNVFAKRGMGFYAGALGGEDSTPGASFATPPRHLKLGTISGTVTDVDTGQPVPNVPVTLAFQGRGVANPTAVSDASGAFAISRVPQGRYSKLVGSSAGYQPARQSVKVTASGATVHFSVRRDWAAASGGAQITASTGADYTAYGCGPVNAIDLSQGAGWSTNAGPRTSAAPTSTYVPKYLVVNMNHRVNITGFGVDPAATCGDGASASTGGYTIATSTDGQNWTPAASGTFTSNDNGRINPVAPAAGTIAGVQYIRFKMTSNQTPGFASNCPGGAYSGCSYTDLTELEVFGAAAP